MDTAPGNLRPSWKGLALIGYRCGPLNVVLWRRIFVSRYQTQHTRYKFAFPQGLDPVTPVLSFDKGKGYRDKPDHSTNSERRVWFVKL